MNPYNNACITRDGSINAVKPEEVKADTFRLDEIIHLTPLVRSFVLESICLRIEDMKRYARYALHLLLEEDGAGNLEGRCPFCGNTGFLLNKSTGGSHCRACGRKEDLFTLTGLLSDSPGSVMNDAVIHLGAYIKLEKEWRAALKPEVSA